MVEGKAESVMCVYNAVNGLPGCASADLLQKRLRELAQRQEMPRGLRTRWVDADAGDPSRTAAINAFLLCRDDKSEND